ncbi:hypothetical protein, partial [Bacteroides sp. 519]|uniref:hypothetical protein n=1 Tax=Bacteroides sp. 519 TaxID=2302937 RepID=UPI0013D35E5C
TADREIILFSPADTRPAAESDIWYYAQNVEFVDQNPIGKSSRSNPVTYIKAYDEIESILPPSRFASLGVIQILPQGVIACELYSGNPDWTPGINTLYQMPDRLYAIKDD